MPLSPGRYLLMKMIPALVGFVSSCLGRNNHPLTRNPVQACATMANESSKPTLRTM